MITILELKERIKETEQELTDLHATLRIMERFQGNKEVNAAKIEETESLEIKEDGIIDLNSLELPTKTKVNKITLLDDIRKVITRFGTQEFTITHIEEVLKRMGKSSDSKSFRNRIAINVKKLLDEGNIIERTYEGSGNDPHRYKLINVE